MPQYHYKAKTQYGKTISGYMECSDKVELIGVLRKNGHYPVSILRKDQFKHNFEVNFKLKRCIPSKDIYIFCRQFATMLSAGVTVLKTIETVRKQTKSIRLRTAIEKINESMLKGSPLSEAMKLQGVFPPLLFHMVEAGEISGNLDIVFEKMAMHFENECKIKQKVKTAMVYPAMVCIMSIVVVFILIMLTVPTFIGMFAGMGVELPTSTKFLVCFCEYIRNNWDKIIFLSVALFFITLFIVSLKEVRHILDLLKLRIPILGEVRVKVTVSRFCRTFGILLASGLPLIKALELVQNVIGNSYVSKRVDKISGSVKVGGSLSVPISQIVEFPAMVGNMMKIGEESGSLEHVLEKLADFYDSEIETDIGRIVSMVEPLVMCVMAAIVGFIIISMVQPMFAIYNNIGG